MMSMIFITLRYMFQRKLRTALTIFSIMFGVAVIFGSNTMIPSIQKSIENMGTPPGQPDLRINRRTAEAFEPAESLDMVRSIEGIDAVSGSFRRNITIPVGDSGAAVELAGIDPATAALTGRYPLKAGRFIEAGDTRSIIMPASAADGAGLDVGDTLELATPGGVELFTIVGLLEDNGSPVTPWLIPLAEMQRIYREPDAITDIDIRLKPDADRELILQTALESLGASYKSAELSGSDMLAYASLNFYGVMALFVGGFLIVNTFRTLVAERRHDFAMMRAIGAEQGQVITLVVTESLVQGAIGTTLGLLVGYGFAAALLSFAQTLGNSSIIVGDMRLYFNWPALFIAITLGMLTTLIAGYLPARAAGKVPPIAALRPEEVEHSPRTAWGARFAGLLLIACGIGLIVAGKATVIPGALLFLFGMVILAPTLIVPGIRLMTPILRQIMPQEADVIAGNVLRQPKRAAVLVNALTVGFAVVIASVVLTGSMGDFFGRLFGSLYPGDMLIVQAGGVTANVTSMGSDSDLRDALLALEELDAVTGLRVTAGQHHDQVMTVIGIEPDSAGRLYPLYLEQGEFSATVDALNSERAAVANGVMAEALNLSMGDMIEIETPDAGIQRYRIAAIGDDNAIPANQYGIVISQANMARDFGVEEDVMLSIGLREGVTSEQARPAIEEVLVDYPQFSLEDVAAYREAGMAGANTAASFFNVMAVVVVIPSLLGLFNTLLINVTERRREIGMLRAIGSDRLQVLRMITAEALILAVLGAVVGVLSGIALGYGFVSLWQEAASRVFGGLYPVIPVSSVAVVVAIGFVLVGVVSLMPARSAARLDIVQVLRYE